MTGPIDLVVPYAGPAALLRETVQSVLGQSDPSWRLVVVEDGDQDPGVRPWLESLGDGRVHYERNPVQLGVSGNFQRCLDLTRAEHVTFLGCDDRLLPRYVEVVRRSLHEHPDVDLVQPGVEVIDAEGTAVRPLGDRVKARLRPSVTRPLELRGEPLLASLVRGNWAYFPSICWRRASVARHGFRADLDTVLDLALLGRVVVEGGSMLVLPETLFAYRRHAASASSLAALRTDRFREERDVTREIASAAASRGWRRAARAARLRPTSRLHAALLLPSAVRTGQRRAAADLARHVVLS